MLFALKKFIGGFLLPLPFLLFLMGIALLLLWFSRWQKTARSILSLSWLVLLLLSLQPVADSILSPLEQQYQTYNGDQPVDYIIVLGGGYSYDPTWAPSSNLFPNTLARVVEGIRQYRKHPGAKLVFTGGNPVECDDDSFSVIALTAKSLGIPDEDIITLTQVHDTEDEMEAVASLVEQQPFILVTSASHMPRAMMLFTEKGLNPIAAPANQLAIHTPLKSWDKIIPSPIYLYHSKQFWHETMGITWIKLKRLFTAESENNEESASDCS